MRKIFTYKNYGCRYPNEYYEENGLLKVRVFNQKVGEKIAIFDMEDFVKLRKCNWKLRKDSKTFYLLNSRKGFAHRYIMECPTQMQIDHINGDGLDNRKSNLRIVSNRENSRNRRTAKGYTFDKDGRRLPWRVHWVSASGKYQTKSFLTEQEARVFRANIEQDVYHRPEEKKN